MFTIFQKKLRKTSFLTILVFLLSMTIPLFCLQDDAFGQRGGGRGGGGRGGGGRGGGGFGGARGGGGGGARATSRPSTGTRATSRPSTGQAAGTRPSGGTRETNNVRGSRTNVYHPERGDINIDRDVEVDVEGGWGWGGDWDGYGVGFFSGLVVGSMVTTLPSTGCAPVMVSGTTYQSCNGVMYQPVYQGSTVQYQVVQTP